MTKKGVIRKVEPSNQSDIDFLLSAQAVKSRCEQIYKLGLQNQLLHFHVVSDRLKPTVDFVMEVIKENYPTLNIPFHSRLRHFEAGGVNRNREFATFVQDKDYEEKARAWFDLVTISVLMDAGAGSHWQYFDHRHRGHYSRSEGLGVLSYNLYCEGWFSKDRKFPYRVDGQVLSSLKEQDLAKAFGVTEKNPLVGLQGRCQLLNNLGRYMEQHPEHFTHDKDEKPRLGNLFHAVTHGQQTIPAAQLLTSLLHILGPIWPSRLSIDSVPLGDTWHHPLVQGEGLTKGLIPFHKLSQWLAYSLMEALYLVGVTVDGPDDLTGLAEYRNGGLLLDMGLIALNDPDQLRADHPIDSPLIIEWRALTVALLDIIAGEIRVILGLDRKTLPLVKILEGGTWSAGRKIAKKLRSDGSSPLRLISDGTVF